MSRRAVILTVVGLVMTLTLLPSHAARAVRAVHADTVDLPTYYPSQLARGSHGSIHPGTEVCTIGEVESTHKERDGDHHVWTCERTVVPIGTGDSADTPPQAPPHAWKAGPLPHTMPERRRLCVLGEIVPRHPLPVPRVGLRIRMCGLWVEEDLAHGWVELHRVTSWATVAGGPPSL